MDRYRWLKDMTQFSNILGASPVNNQILFFDGHNIHFDDRALIQTKIKNIHHLILKAVESINDNPNENRYNSKLKDLYKISKSNWMLNYITTRFQPHLMNYVLVETR